ncbi:TOBE domain-containing protein [Stutzerimonas kirkiae]|uniref:Molybdenum-dependent transcriptional regulator n=1 Tax=Stutzerimonas kirkiae TaxID=2211392 RepID=A0A4Q9R8A9_9GAMM|nr:TOBE domain-containing protein [Stutzerimonas kirkiae]TBU96894.1 molybdenum-dependent transcriptional regulator [Stutzerimonas kirkiae]TBV00508.1 molybdenum-dependent transcriptional regulator [Stutzerimonas kirkiae]TBV04035.1 molybdenum-dependent transcriptional regulator [Stutzerimonas kirkiae]TBV16757.1 molybdenum-dependent transcriptional regulator [Stutzerimonas kirkiae]
MSATRFLARMSLDTEVGTALSDTRIRLLEAIQREGSINRAAKAVPLSYKAAWDALDTLNNLAPEPLVSRTIGGRQGGGTQLTDYGRRIVAMYRALEIEYQATLDRLAERLKEVDGGDIQAFQKLMHRMSMKTSARNQFSGPVTGLRTGGIDYEVRIQLDADTEIAAIITSASAENLGLAIGREVTALVKSSSVMLAIDPSLRLTARNQLWGTVSTVHEGPVNSEVTLTLPSGRSVTCVVTAASCKDLGITPGLRACALFKASSVILAVCE